MREVHVFRKTKNAIKYWIIGESAFVIFIFFFIVGSVVLWNIFDINANISLVRKSIEGMRAAVVSLNIDALKEQNSEGVDAIHAVHARLAPFDFVSHLPFIGKNYSALIQMLSDCERLLEDSELIVNGIDDALRPARKETGELSFQRMMPEQKREVIQKIFELLPLTAGIESQIALSRARIEFIDELQLYPPLKTVKREMEAQLGIAGDIMRDMRPFIEFLPFLTGYPQEKTYLFLLQNNTEVRATGGFIGTYGILKIKDAQIYSFITDNVYNLDDSAASFLAVDPPPPFLRYFPPSDRKWFLRDSNWFPSFDESARQAEWFYAHEGGSEKLDGVISITPDVLSSILAISGPITIEGREFRADNAPDELEFQVEQGYYQRGLPAHKRKEVIGTLSGHLLERMGNFSFEQWRAFVEVLRRHIQEKNILAYMNDSHAQDNIKTLGMTGDVIRTDAESDYLMVVDSNMRSQKTDAVMKKEISYAIHTNEKGDALATVRLMYTHTAHHSWKVTDYHDWVRIFVPQGSVFMDAGGVSKNPYSGVIEPIEQSVQNGKTVFAGFFSIPSLSSRSFDVTYQLPKNISRAMKEGKYSFFIQKQSGVSGVKSTFTAVFPYDIENVSTYGIMEEQKIDKNTLFLSTFLHADKKIDVTFRAGAQ
jgi:hypothetical protein